MTFFFSLCRNFGANVQCQRFKAMVKNLMFTLFTEAGQMLGQYVYDIVLHQSHLAIVVPKSETRGFDSWLTSSLIRIECNFPLATSDVEMMSEAKLYSMSRGPSRGPNNFCVYVNHNSCSSVKPV